MAQILGLVERGCRDPHNFAASLDELDGFGYRSCRVHRIADRHRLHADWIIPPQWYVTNRHDTGLAAMVIKGIMTVCRQRDHGGPFATRESGLGTTDTRWLYRINVLFARQRCLRYASRTPRRA